MMLRALIDYFRLAKKPQIKDIKKHFVLHFKDDSHRLERLDSHE